MWIYNLISRSSDKIALLIKQEINHYTKRGIGVYRLHIDNESNIQSIDNTIKPEMLHQYEEKKHVHVINRRNRTMKEQMRSVIESLLYKNLLRALVVEIEKLIIKG